MGGGGGVEWRETMRQITLLMFNQKIPGQLIKIILLGKVKQQFGQVLNLGFQSWTLLQVKLF